MTPLMLVQKKSRLLLKLISSSPSSQLALALLGRDLLPKALMGYYDDEVNGFS